jgi:hypothetical protein
LVARGLGSEGQDSYLELNWYASDSPHYTKFVGGDQLDHFGIRVEDFEGTLKRLGEGSYPVAIGPIHSRKWHFAFVRAFEGIWLDVHKVDEGRRKATALK